MKFIKINKNKIYTSKDCAVLDNKTGKWEPAKPALYSCNIREWFIHNILGKHFTFGQPYCVVCGYSELIDNENNTTPVEVENKNE